MYIEQDSRALTERVEELESAKHRLQAECDQLTRECRRREQAWQQERSGLQVCCHVSIAANSAPAPYCRV